MTPIYRTIAHLDDTSRIISRVKDDSAMSLRREWNFGGSCTLCLTFEHFLLARCNLKSFHAFKMINFSHTLESSCWFCTELPCLDSPIN